jgi:signal transduction histidine kinase
MEQSFDILNSFVDSIAIVNADGDIMYTNHAWKQFSIENSGSLSKTDRGVNYLELCKKVTGEELQNATDALVGICEVIKRERHIFEMEYPCHSDNERRWFILRCTPLKEETNLTIISHVNVSKRKLAEEVVEKKNEQLVEINKRLHNTNFKIAHDIQSPLNSIEGLINLSRDAELDQSISSYFTLIEKSVSNLKEYILETLNIAKSNVKTEPVNFKTVFNDFYESVKYAGIPSKIKIKNDISQDSEFYTYKTEIISVISNLIGNSLKYYDAAKDKSFIEVSIHSNDHEARISVKDNGIGINEDVISKIFDLNFQVNKSLVGGSGIGLNLVKKSVELMNGSIHVSSEFGIGTEFTCVIPNLKEFKE